MGAVSALSYLVLGSARVGEWQELSEKVLGAKTTIDGDGVLRVRVDERLWRWEIRPSAREELIAVGWEASSPAELDKLVERNGAEFVAAPECAARNVHKMVALSDSDGTRHEIGIGSAGIVDPPASPVDMKFVTDGMGFGHAAMFCKDLNATLAFVTDVLGMKLSDTIAHTDYTVYFYRCNRRHHSLALVQGDRPHRIHHLMLQVDELDIVGRASEVAKAKGIYVRTLGRHTNDLMFSFYCRTPSGFDIEYGWGGIEIEEDSWTVFEHDASSIWGHIKL